MDDQQRTQTDSANNRTESVREAFETHAENTQATWKRSADETRNRASEMVGRAAEGAKEILGDLKDGTDAAVEGNARVTQQLGAAAEYGLEALSASSRLSLEGVGILSREAAELGRKNFEHMSGAMRQFTQARRPSELFQLQGEFARASLENTLACSTRIGESLLLLAGEMIESIGRRSPQRA